MPYDETRKDMLAANLYRTNSMYYKLLCYAMLMIGMMMTTYKLTQ
jgi:hypothetical protein